MGSTVQKPDFVFFHTLLFLLLLTGNILPAAEEVFVFPEAHHGPVVKFIDSARDSIDMSAYKFTDEQVIGALRAAAERGVRVRLIMENKNIYYRPGESTDATLDPAAALVHPNVSIFRTSPRFSQSHYKMILVDSQKVLISTGNFCPSTFAEVHPDNPYRDFMLETDEPSVVQAVLKGFQADTEDKRVVLDHPHVIWGPDQTRSSFLKLINGAQRSIDVYQQDLTDEGLAKALAGAARADVRVRVLMNPFPFGGEKDPNVPHQTLLSEAGAEVMLCPKIYKVMHAKVVIVDGKEMYLGSCNFYTPSIDQTRELGVVTHHRHSIEPVLRTFEQDWMHGKLFVPPVGRSNS